MSFLGNYFGSKGVVTLSLNSLSAERKTYEAFRTKTTFSLYLCQLISSISVLYSASNAVWQLWNLHKVLQARRDLKKLVEEYLIASRDPEIALTTKPEYIEILVAAMLLLAKRERDPENRQSWYKEAEELTLIALKKDFPSRILLQARHATNPVVAKKERALYRNMTIVSVEKMIEDNPSPEKLEQKLPQGYKTVCRIGRILGDWHLCHIGLRHDRSLDLRMKTYIFPGYLWYSMRAKVGLVT